MDLLALKCDIHGVTTHICQYTCCKCASESAVATPSASTNNASLQYAAQEVLDEYNSRKRIDNDRLYSLIEALARALPTASIA